MNIKTMGQIEITHWDGRVLYTYQPADASGLTMRHALESASSSGADLSGAVLIGADLRGAVLIGADLSGSVLIGSVLRGADLRGATVYGVKITRAPVVVDGLHWPVQIIDGHIKIGCQLHAISAWASFDDAAIAAMDGRDALRFWREHKAAIMALAAPFPVTA
jgi:uncharacterized protein YjbI with pentapeptide repeats